MKAVLEILHVKKDTNSANNRSDIRGISFSNHKIKWNNVTNNVGISIHFYLN